MESQYLKNIKVGQKVMILTNQNKYATGLVEEIASRNPFHENGIMVRLRQGEVGRVKKIFPTQMEKQDAYQAEIKKILSTGEDLHTEFKAEALWSIYYTQEQLKMTKSFELREYGQKASKVIIAKSIASFLNTDGGNLLIGIKEDREQGKFEIIGIEEDLKKLHPPGIDSFKRIILDEIFKSFFPAKIYNHLDSYAGFEFVQFNDKTICHLKIKKSDTRVFLKINDKEIFMIRIDSENKTLEGEKLVDYCIKKWGTR